jgi:hypothetical protein
VIELELISTYIRDMNVHGKVGRVTLFETAEWKSTSTLKYVRFFFWLTCHYGQRVHLVLTIDLDHIDQIRHCQPLIDGLPSWCSCGWHLILSHGVNLDEVRCMLSAS